MTSLDRHATRLFLAVLTLSLATLIPVIRKVAYFPRADEGVYLRYARAVGEGGLDVLPELTRSYLQTNPGVWPLPTRVGFILPAAVAMRLFEDGTPQPITYLSTVAFLATVITAFWFVRRNTTPTLALVTVTLLVFSPLLTGLSRRALSDSTLTFLTIALLAAFYEALVRASRPATLFFGLLLTWILLTKETAFLVLPVLATIGVVMAWRRRPAGPRSLLALGIASAVAFLAAGLAFVAIAGGVGPLLDLARYSILSVPVNSYVIQNYGGPWYHYVVDAAALSPLTVLLAACFSFYYLLTRGRGGANPFVDFVGLYGLLTLLVHTVMATQTGGYAVGVRQLLPLEFPLRFLAACGLVGAARAAGPRLAPLGLAGACVALVSQDAVTFHRAFVSQNLYDPSTPAIFKALGFLPQHLDEDRFVCWSRDVPAPATGQSPDQLMERGRTALFVGNNGAEAEFYFRALLERDASFSGARYHLALTLDTCGRIVEARALWMQVLDRAVQSGDEATANDVRGRLAAYDWPPRL